MAEIERVPPTKYRQAIMRVLSSYPPGSIQLITAIDIVVRTAMTNATSEGRDELAEQTCLGTLHPGPPKGVICRRCFDAVESGKLPEEEQEALLPAVEEDSIAKQVRDMLGDE